LPGHWPPKYFVKLPFLLLLPLLVVARPGGPSALHVTFSPLTKAAYLQAKKSCVVTKPRVTFPLKKANGRLVIPTAKGRKVFQDRGVGTDNDDQAQYEYLGYLQQFGTHVLLAHLWERTQWFMIDKDGRQIELYDAPLYSPDGKSFVAIAAGLEYPVYPNSLLLYRFAEGRWRQVWALEPTTWEPVDICWNNSSTLLLKKKTWTPRDLGSTASYSRLVIR
jgi:hypothetical protein